MSWVGAIWLPGSVLTAPAMIAAGLAASPHCALMCGAVGFHQLQATPQLKPLQALRWLHTGRVAGYAVLGAIAGGAGQSLLGHLPPQWLGRAIQLLFAFGVMLLGWRIWRRSASAPACCQPPVPTRLGRWPASLQQLIRGVLWAAMPCALVYSLLLLAALSGSAAHGALLSASFALGGVPALALTAGGGTRLASAAPAVRRYGAWALMLLGGIGVAGILLMDAGLSPWCLAVH